MATAGILGTISCLRYELAIVTSNDEKDASSILWGCIILSLLVGIVIFTSFFVLSKENLIYQDSVHLNVFHHSIFISLIAALISIGSTLQYWNTRHKLFFHNSIALVVSSSTTAAIQLIWALEISPTPYGLLLGSACGLLAAILFRLGAILFTKTIPVLSWEVVSRILECMKKNRRFLLYSTPYALFGVVRDRATILIMEIFLPMQIVGLYALAYRVMNFPVTLVSNAIRPVFFQACSSQGVMAIEPQLNRIMKWLVIIAMPCVVFYLYFAEEMFMLFFGSKWQGAGNIGKILIFPVFTFLLVNWMDRIMDVLGEQRLTLILETIFSSLSLLGLLVGFLLGLGFIKSLIIQCSILVIYNITYLIIAFERAGYDRRKPFKLMPLAFVITVITTLVIEIFKVDLT